MLPGKVFGPGLPSRDELHRLRDDPLEESRQLSPSEILALLPAYFNKSATFAMPALPQASACSWLDPELPTPPMISLPTRIGTPPPRARMSATSRCAAYGPSLVRF